MNYYPRYQKLSLFSISWPSSIIAPSSLFPLLLNLHSIYSVLGLLKRRLLDSKVSHQIPNLTLTLLLVLFTKSIHQETSSWVGLVISSITSAKRYGLNVDSWCKLIVVANTLVIPPLVLTIQFIQKVHETYQHQSQPPNLVLHNPSPRPTQNLCRREQK